MTPVKPRALRGLFDGLGFSLSFTLHVGSHGRERNLKVSGSNGGEDIFPSGLEDILGLFGFSPTLLSLYMWGNRGTEGPVTHIWDKGLWFPPLSRPGGRTARKPTLTPDGRFRGYCPQPCACPSPKSATGHPCKPFSFASSTGLPQPHGTLELDEILYDPMLRYVLLNAPVPGSAGSCASPIPRHPLLLHPHLSQPGRQTAATPPPASPLAE